MKIEKKIDDQLDAPARPSGHAFVCFDSNDAANHMLHKYNLGATDAVKLMCHTLTDKTKECFNRNVAHGDGAHGNGRSNSFSRFEDETENFFDQDVTLIMEPAKEPMDICWNNMGGHRGLYFWRRFFLLLVCFFVVIFLSTPSAILAALKHVDVLNLSEAG